MAMKTLSLSDFQSRCVFLLKQVEQVGEGLLIVENEHPIARILPCEKNSIEKQTTELLSLLRGNVQRYDAPDAPVGENDWEVLKC